MLPFSAVGRVGGGGGGGVTVPDVGQVDYYKEDSNGTSWIYAVGSEFSLEGGGRSLSDTSVLVYKSPITTVNSNTYGISVAPTGVVHIPEITISSGGTLQVTGSSGLGGCGSISIPSAILGTGGNLSLAADSIEVGLTIYEDGSTANIAMSAATSVVLLDCVWEDAAQWVWNLTNCVMSSSAVDAFLVALNASVDETQNAIVYLNNISNGAPGSAGMAAITALALKGVIVDPIV